MSKKLMYISSILFMFVAGLAVRIIYILRPNGLDSEMATAALMAKHIIEFKDFPIYLRLTHYVGAFSSYLGAVLFLLFGISSFNYMFVGVIFSCLWVVFTLLLAKRVLDRQGFIIAMILVIFPPLNILMFSVYSGGINAEDLCCGALLLLLLVKFNSDDYRNKKMFYALFGFAIGFALWLTPGVVPMVLAIITVCVIKKRERLFSSKPLFTSLFYCFIGGYILGNSPAIIYNFQHPYLTLFRFAARTLHIDYSVLTSQNIVGSVLSGLWWRIFTIPRSCVRLLVILFKLIGVVNFGVFSVAIFVFAKRSYREFLKNKKIDYTGICLIFIFWFVIFYIICVGETAIRYGAPLFVVFPILAGKLLAEVKIRKKLIFGLLFGAILFQSMWSVGQSVGRSFLSKDKTQYRELAKYLLSKKFFYGYASDSTAYPVIFESREKILISPTLFATYSDGYPDYTRKVRNAKEPVYIIRKNEYPDVITYTEKELKKMGISYNEAICGEFVIFSGFDIKPEQLDLYSKITSLTK